MKLKQNSWHDRYYKWFWNTKEMPNNLCNYFWGLLGAILLIVPCWISVVISKKEGAQNEIKNLLFSFLLNILFISIGVTFYEKNISNITETYMLVISYFIGAILCAVFATIVILFVFLCVKCEAFLTKKRKQNKVKTVKTNILKEYIRNVKEKSCLILEWEKDDK